MFIVCVYSSLSLIDMKEQCRRHSKHVIEQINHLEADLGALAPLEFIINMQTYKHICVCVRLFYFCQKKFIILHCEPMHIERHTNISIRSDPVFV